MADYTQHFTGYGDLDGYIDSILAGYVAAGGTIPLTANWDVGGYNITNIGNLEVNGCIKGGTAADAHVNAVGSFSGSNFPVLEIIRDSVANGSGLFGAAILQRKMNTGVAEDRSGIGFYFKTQNDADEIVHAGMFGGILSDVSDGAEIGSIAFGAAWQTETDGSLAARRDLAITATGTNTADVFLGRALAPAFTTRLLVTGNTLMGLTTAQTSPSAPLHVHGATGATYIMVHDSVSGALDEAGIKFSTIVTGRTDSSKNMIVHQESATAGSYGRGDLVFCNNNDANDTDVSVSDEVMRITYAGIDITGTLAISSNVGFYGTSPVTQNQLQTGVGATVDNVITELQRLGLIRQAA